MRRLVIYNSYMNNTIGQADSIVFRTAWSCVCAIHTLHFALLDEYYLLYLQFPCWYDEWESQCLPRSSGGLYWVIPVWSWCRIWLLSPGHWWRVSRRKTHSWTVQQDGKCYKPITKSAFQSHQVPTSQSHSWTRYIRTCCTHCTMPCVHAHVYTYTQYHCSYMTLMIGVHGWVQHHITDVLVHDPLSAVCMHPWMISDTLSWLYPRGI